MKGKDVKTSIGLDAYLGGEYSLLSSASKAVFMAEKAGATEVEVYALRRVVSNCFIEKLQVTFAQRKVQTGLGIRVAQGKRIGFCCTSSPSDESVKETVAKALKIAQARGDDPRFRSFPAQKISQKAIGIFDKKVKEAEIEDLIHQGVELAEVQRDYDRRIESGNGSITYTVYNRAIANSSGANIEESDTIVDARTSSMAKEDGEASSGDYYEMARNLSDLNVQQVGRMASKLAVDLLKRKPTETKTMDLVLHPYALGDLFTYTLHPGFMGDNLTRGRTPFAGKSGKKVASDIVTIRDNGILERGLATQSFDDEGSSRRNTTLIEQGVVKSFLYDSLWASQAKIESTGNSSRRDNSGLRTYGSEPVIETTNVVVSPGQKGLEEMVSEVEDGIFAYYLIGAHTSNISSGAFSVGLQSAFRIEHGAITYAVKEAMVGGDVIQLLNKVTGIADDTRTWEDELRHRVTITPSIRFSDVKVSA